MNGLNQDYVDPASSTVPDDKAIPNKGWLSLKEKLSRSKFRSKFKLGKKDFDYIQIRGLGTIRSHALDFIRKRLAPAKPRNDGKQTPMHGHPVFIAQHATGTCCRSCLQKWHAIPEGRDLTDIQIQYVVSVLIRWISESRQSIN